MTTILAGVVPPTSGDGATTDYYVDTAHAVLYGPKASGSYGAAVSCHPTAPTGIAANAWGNNRSAGSRFQVTVDGRITSLRHYRHASATATTRKMILWSDAGANLGEVTTTAETGSGWITVALSSPVNVTAGQYYRVGSDLLAGDYNSAKYTAPPAPVSPSLANLTCLNSGGQGVMPTTNDGETYFTDVLFESAPVGDLWPVALRGVVSSTTGPSGPGVGDVWVDRT